MTYSQLARLPLLQGISAEYMHYLHEKGALRQVTIEPQEGEIIRKGERCRSLVMLLDGRLMCSTHSEEWELEETIDNPCAIESEALFSLSQTYGHTYRPLTEGHLLVIERQNIIHMLQNNDVFLINLLSHACTSIERLSRTQLPQLSAGIEDKIRMFLRRIVTTRTYPKTLNIKMKTLADIIGETRLNTSKALRRMEDAGLISLSRQHIRIEKL